jgi:hypothetical protein
MEAAARLSLAPAQDSMGPPKSPVRKLNPYAVWCAASAAGNATAAGPVRRHAVAERASHVPARTAMVRPGFRARPLPTTTDAGRSERAARAGRK